MNSNDSTDRLLRSFFASEMPTVWPSPPAVAVVRRPTRQTGSLAGSRIALAASVLVLVGCCLALSGPDSADVPRPSSRPGIDGGNANLPKELRPPVAPAPGMLPK